MSMDAEEIIGCYILAMARAELEFVRFRLRMRRVIWALEDFNQELKHAAK
jgi:hypothetical protein